MTGRIVGTGLKSAGGEFVERGFKELGDRVGAPLLNAFGRLLRGEVADAPADVVTSAGIVRNALSNADEIPLQAAEALSLGPATNRISREAYGGSDLVRGGVIGTTDVAPLAPRAPVPGWTGGSTAPPLTGSTPSQIIESIPAQVDPRVVPVRADVRRTTTAPEPEWTNQMRPVPVQTRTSQGVQAPQPEFPNTVAPPQSPFYGRQGPQELVTNYGNTVPRSAPMQGARDAAGNLIPTPQNRIPASAIDSIQTEIPFGTTRFPAGTSAASEFVTSRGAVRAAGSPVGGKFYNLDAATTPEARSVAEDLIQQARIQASTTQPFIGPRAGVPAGQLPLNLSSSITPVTPNPVQAAAIEAIESAAPGAGRGVNAEEFIARRAPSIPDAVGGGSVLPKAGNEGAFLTNLANIDPRLAVGGLAAIGGAGLTTYGLSQGEKLRRGGELPMTAAAEEELPGAAAPNTLSESVPAGLTPAQLQQLSDVRRGMSVGLYADNEMASLDPSIEPEPTVTPGSQVISDGGRSERTAALQQDPAAVDDAMIERYMEPMSPEKYNSIEEYYAARDNYANQADVKKAMKTAGRQLADQRKSDAAFDIWAAANPGLMYELQQRMLANPGASQQTNSSVGGVRAVSTLGPNADQSAVTFGQAVGSGDLSDASQPYRQPILENLPLRVQQRLANQTFLR